MQLERDGFRLSVLSFLVGGLAPRRGGCCWVAHRGGCRLSEQVDIESVDVCLITHFHIDHVGALPYLTEQLTFKGRVFMTHPVRL